VAVRLNDFDDFEDATLLRQKIAACFAAFVTDPDGVPGGLGATNTAPNELIETIEPGMVNFLKAGQEINFANPPVANDTAYCTRVLRSVAVGMGITYEQISGDLSGVNFSSGKMGQLEFQNNVEHWRWNMLIPHGCQGVWDWFVLAGQIKGIFEDRIPVQWTPPPYRMIDPPKEIAAMRMKIRSGLTSLSEAIREQGYEPENLFNEMESDNKSLDSRGLIVDTDPRNVSLAGTEQPSSSSKSSDPADDTPATGEDQ
jgi:lambda family phage portal protein